MNNQNHTNVQHLVDDHNQQKQHKKPHIGHISRPPEAGPLASQVEAPISPEEEKAPEQEVSQEQHKELEQYVQAVDETQKLKLADDLKKAGLKSVDEEQLPPSFQNVQLPLSDDKVIAGLNEPVTSSYRWLAEFALAILKHAHLGLKKVHGHVVRVVKR